MHETLTTGNLRVDFGPTKLQSNTYAAPHRRAARRRKVCTRLEPLAIRESTFGQPSSSETLRPYPIGGQPDDAKYAQDSTHRQSESRLWANQAPVKHFHRTPLERSQTTQSMRETRAAGNPRIDFGPTKLQSNTYAAAHQEGSRTTRKVCTRLKPQAIRESTLGQPSVCPTLPPYPIGGQPDDAKHARDSNYWQSESRLLVNQAPVKHFHRTA